MGECYGRTPGPAYALNSLTGYNNHDISKSRAPAYSLGLKTYTGSLQKTPGPYNVGNVDRNGRYPYCGWTMESPAGLKVKPFGPGPADYPGRIPYNSPAYSLGLKIGSRLKPFGPSPADYYPQPHCAGGPAFTIGSAGRNVARFVPPGPQAATPLDRYKQRSPAYSLGLRGPPLEKQSVGPGPAYLPGRVCRHHVPHSYSFGLKHSLCAPPMITYEDNE